MKKSTAQTTKTTKVEQKSEEEAPQVNGDNPNKQKSSGRKRQDGPKNAILQTKPILESIDPIPPDMTKIDVQGVVDARAPGTPFIGKIFLRIEAFEELGNLVSSMIESTQGLVYQRVDLPDLRLMAGFITNYSLAHQLFTSLSLNSAEGPFRKLKVLRMANLDVPDFLPPLVQSFGNYTSAEGLMKVAYIEQLIPMLIEEVLAAYQQIPGVRRLPGFNPIRDVVLYDSSNFREDFIDLVSVMHPEIFEPVRLIVAAAVDVLVTPDMREGPVADLIELFQHPRRLQMDEAVQRKIIAYLNLRDLDFEAAGAPDRMADLNLLELEHGSRRPIEQLADWLNVAIPEYQRVCYRALKTLFMVSRFVPTTGGTSAQCVVADRNATVDYARATHKFALAPTSAAIGFILMPAVKVEYNPMYMMYSTKSRYQHMMSSVEKYVVKELSG